MDFASGEESMRILGHRAGIPANVMLETKSRENMKLLKIQTLIVFFLSFAFCIPLFAQGRIEGKLNLGATVISQGDLKVGEVLMTRDGIKIPPGQYRVGVLLNARNEAQFAISPFSVDKPPVDTSANSMAPKSTVEQNSLYLVANVDRNTLVKGYASNLPGDFRVDNLTPSEAVLSFQSKQFQASTVLGRSTNSKLIDMSVVSLELQDLTECGTNCMEATVKVVVKNEGNMAATGKWNVLISEPRFFVGAVSDVAPGAEQTVVSASKVKVPCCAPLNLQAEVRADFYNKNAIDSNNYNNVKSFSVKLK
jgi:hypothetical protein